RCIENGVVEWRRDSTGANQIARSPAGGGSWPGRGFGQARPRRAPNANASRRKIADATGPAQGGQAMGRRSLGRNGFAFQRNAPATLYWQAEGDLHAFEAPQHS